MSTKKQALQIQRNFLEEYISMAKERCDKARAKYFCRLTVEYFEYLAVVTIMIQDRVQVACFLEEDLAGYWPVFTYWLTREERIPLISRMYKQGISGVKIAQFLKLSAATVYRDLQYVRKAQPFKIENRINLARTAQRPARIIADADFKMAALNFEDHKRAMKQAFAEARGQTLQ